jgi:DNA polymerase elongation subunit (family B)
MTDSEQILIRMQEGFEKVSEGFGKVYSRIDDLGSQAHQRQLNCGSRFADIEQTLAVKTALNGEHDKTREADVDREGKRIERKYDWEKWFVRIMLGTILTTLLIFFARYVANHVQVIF